jgi:hypothetical protein
MRKAEGFLRAADEICLLDAASELQDPVVTLYVHAGIAATDVICCARLAKYSVGDNHAEAIALLKAADSPSAKHLQTLLSMKSKVGYSHERASPGDATKAGRAAGALVEAARRVAD